MSAPPPTSPRAPVRAPGSRGPLVLAIAVVVFLGLAVAKPWQASPATPAATTEPAPGSVIASTGTTSPPAPTPIVAVHPTENPSPGMAFTIAPPVRSGTLPTSVRWRRIADDDPLRLVTTIRRWRGGFVAVGRADGLTPIWASTDGTMFEPVPPGTADTLWPGQVVVGSGATGDGVALLTEEAAPCTDPCTPIYSGPIISWVSRDGRRWTPHLLSEESLRHPDGRTRVLAAGPAGLVAASVGGDPALAASADGVGWRAIGNPLGSDFALTALTGSPGGYIAIGRLGSAAGGVAAAAWSADGTHWSLPTPLPDPRGAKADGGAPASPAGGAPASPAGVPRIASTADDILVAVSGAVVRGRIVRTPGAAAWWRTADGRDWNAVPSFFPLGIATCVEEGCPGAPAGTLASDGERMVAVQFGARAAAWVSGDGARWSPLAMSGAIPNSDGVAIALFPSGILVTDGWTSWIGELATR